MPRSSASCAGFLQHHRNARVGVIHRDAAAHGSRADDGRAPNVVRLEFPWECPGFCAPCARRRTRESALSTASRTGGSVEELGFARAAFVEWQRGGASTASIAASGAGLAAPASCAPARAPESKIAVFRGIASFSSALASFGTQADSRLLARTPRAPFSKSPSMMRSTIPSRQRLLRAESVRRTRTSRPLSPRPRAAEAAAFLPPRE